MRRRFEKKVMNDEGKDGRLEGKAMSDDRRK
jgi:hypothetical protein